LGKGRIGKRTVRKRKDWKTDSCKKKGLVNGLFGMESIGKQTVGIRKYWKTNS
jgi:hypothetical protein